MSKTFDANRRLAELALWVDDGSRWLDRATAPANVATPRTGRTVHVAFDRAELETFVAGLRGVARSLMGLAQPVPPFFGTSPLARRHPHLVEWAHDQPSDRGPLPKRRQGPRTLEGGRHPG